MQDSLDKSSTGNHTQYRQSLGQQVNTVQQEARMVLPGIQALFGFQMIAVFNQGFQSNLTYVEKMVHLMALLLVAIAAVLVMAPAAYHRQAKHQISKHFIEFSSEVLAWSMAPLALGTCLDIYIVVKMTTGSLLASLVIAIAFFIFYSWTWFIFPRISARKIAALPTHMLPNES